MKLLNLGCGYRFHPDWINVNFISTGQEVIAYDLTQGIPFADNSFDLVYHSHLLEHFSKKDAKIFLDECYRVLRPKGILRVVVPDLEQIIRLYISLLEQAKLGSQTAAPNYEWILLEMYDQVTREHPGGEMESYLSQESIQNEEFVIDRCGIFVKKMIELARHKQDNLPLPVKNSKIQQMLKPFYRFFRYPKYRAELMLKILLGKEYSTLQLGRFRKSGEIHQWMYDSYSLALLLKSCELEDIVQRNATESYLPNWASYNLDTEPDGTVYKPDSLFMEAIKAPLQML